MTQATLEHVNVTVSDPKRTVDRLCKIYGWKIRWQGDAIDNGYTYHVGSDDSYLAIYSKGAVENPIHESYQLRGGLNHIAIVVDDLDKTEKRVLKAGYETFSHGDYEPGRRFYYRDEDNIEFEVVSYV